jgi:hypothetical protein
MTFDMTLSEKLKNSKIGPEIPAPQALVLTRRLLAENPLWNRTRLSRELCRRWNWRRPDGQPKDMTCRDWLLKFERAGLIVLPPRQGPTPNTRRNLAHPLVPHANAPITDSLNALRPLRVMPVAPRSEQAKLFNCLLSRYHYLGFKNTVGANLRYLAQDRFGRPLACLLFGSAAWRTAPRDRFIGWSQAAREQNLSLITNNTRFLILPWVRVPHLASHLLARVARRLNTDWRSKYGRGIQLLETFVDRSRFQGTCYRAANWALVGRTTGRTRNDREHRPQAAVKDVYVYPLNKNFREVLRHVDS